MPEMQTAEEIAEMLGDLGLPKNFFSDVNELTELMKTEADGLVAPPKLK